MNEYKLKYSGPKIDELLDKINNLEETNGSNNGSNNGSDTGNFIKKNVEDSTSEKVTFEKGIVVGNYTEGLLSGKGGIFKCNSDNTTTLTTDFLNVRKKASFNELEIKALKHIGGTILLSPANAVIDHVEETATSYLCYFKSSDGEKEVKNEWAIGDQAKCLVFGDPSKGSAKYYWRLVTNVTSGEDYHCVTLSKTVCSTINDDAPEAGDNIVQFGNREDESRQSAILLSAYDVEEEGDAPCIIQYDNVNSFNLTGKIVQRISPKGNIFTGSVTITGGSALDTLNSLTNEINSLKNDIGNVETTGYFYQSNEPVFNSAEEAFAHEGWLWYNSVNGEIKIFVVTEMGGDDLIWVPFKDNEATSLLSSIAALVENLKTKVDQIDGRVDSYFLEGTPTVDNEPAKSWTDLDAPIGDSYTDIGEGSATYGKSWNWVKTETLPTDITSYKQSNGFYYYWLEIVNPSLQEALNIASKAKDVADGKSSIFTSDNPENPQGGDLWILPEEKTINSKTYQKGEVLTYDGSKWTKTISYVNDAGLDEKIEKFFNDSGYAQTLKDVKDQVDQKAQTWYQNNDPSTNWTTDDLKSQHTGDLWYCTKDISVSGVVKYLKNTTYYWDGTAWKTQEVPAGVFDAIDGKANIFVTTPKPPYHEGDMWINVKGTITDDYGKTGIFNNDILRCLNTRKTGKFSIDDWTLASAYVGQAAIDTLQNQINSIKTSDASAYAYLKEALQGSTKIEGGLVLTNLLMLGNSGNSIDNVTAGISGNTSSSENVAIWAGGTLQQAIDLVENPKNSNAAKFALTHDGKAILNDAIVSGTINATNGKFNNGEFDNVTIKGTYNRLVQVINDNNKSELISAPNSTNYWEPYLLRWGDVIYLNSTPNILRLPYLIPNVEDSFVWYDPYFGAKLGVNGERENATLDDLRSLIGREIIIYNNTSGTIRFECPLYRDDTDSSSYSSGMIVSTRELGEFRGTFLDAGETAGPSCPIGSTIVLECIQSEIFYEDLSGNLLSAEVITWAVKTFKNKTDVLTGEKVEFAIRPGKLGLVYFNAGKNTTWGELKGDNFSIKNDTDVKITFTSDPKTYQVFYDDACTLSVNIGSPILSLLYYAK